MSNVNLHFMRNPTTAWELGLSLSTELKNNVDDFMFMYATKPDKYLKINSNATIFDSYGESQLKLFLTKK